MSTHQFRALADAFILGANPHAIEDLRLVLGHTTFDTSMRFYASSAPKGAVARLCEGDHDGAPAHPAPRWCEVRDSRELLADAIALFEMGSTGRGYAHGRVAVRDAALLGLLATHGPRIRSVGAMEMRSDHVATFCKAFIEEWNRAQAEVSVGAEGARRDFQGVQRKLDNLVDAIAEGSPRARRAAQARGAGGAPRAAQGGVARPFGGRAGPPSQPGRGLRPPSRGAPGCHRGPERPRGPGSGPRARRQGHRQPRAGARRPARDRTRWSPRRYAAGRRRRPGHGGRRRRRRPQSLDLRFGRGGAPRGQSPSILHRQAHGPPVSGPLVR